MSQPKRILICPLDWGLGHATRCIPIIRLLLKKNAQIIIAAGGRPLELLRLEFPNLTFIPFEGYNISYPESGSMTFKMLLSAPKILQGIKKEQAQLEKIVEEQKIDIVISDNRYGCYSKKVPCIFITHQLMIKAPLGESSLHQLVLKYVKKYRECWIPDEEGKNSLSGDLSHKYKLPENTFFIGAQSRFESGALQPKANYDLLAIISGPEPQRSIFEKLILEQLQKTKLKALVVSGRTEIPFKRERTGSIEIVNHLNAFEMREAIANSAIIVSRSGYSTIMDLAALGKKTIFVPTPGQTEQEYLAKLFFEKGIAFYQGQKKFDLAKALEKSKNYSGFGKTERNNAVEKRIDLLLNPSST